VGEGIGVARTDPLSDSTSAIPGGVA